MKVLTLILITLLSLSVYAKTEAGLSSFGFTKKKGPTRSVANTTQGLEALSKLGQLNQSNPSSRRYESDYAGFAGTAGALTKKRTPANGPKKVSKGKITK